MTVPPDEAALGEESVALVTGSTDGIGAETARNLAATGATLVVHGRDREKGEALVTALPGDDHVFYRADFADPEEVRTLADAVTGRFDRLDALVNNAGTWQGSRRLVDLPGSDAGVEFTFTVNHLAPFLLTNLLADRLAATGRRRGETRGGDPGADPARVVTVSSNLHRRATLDLDGVVGADGPSGVDSYAHSKLANVLFTVELARRLPPSVTATACHPGVSPATGLSRDGSTVAGIGWKALGLFGRLVGFTDSPAESAATQTYLAADPEVTGTTGAYFADCEQAAPSDAATDRDVQRRLWDASAEWLQLPERAIVGAADATAD